jgi:hypothetical protein
MDTLVHTLKTQEISVKSKAGLNYYKLHYVFRLSAATRRPVCQMSGNGYRVAHRKQIFIPNDERSD